MVHSDSAIFLHKIKYGDSGLVLKLYTKHGGYQSFLIQGLKGKKKSIPALLHPLAELELTFSKPLKGSLNRIKEIQPSQPLHNIRNDFYKSSLAYFVAEVILKSIQESEPNTDLYNYLSLSIHLLDSTEKSGNFHLIFLLRLSQFLGFYPQGKFTRNQFFDLQEGSFTLLRPQHLHYLEQHDAKLMSTIITEGFDFLNEPLARVDRKTLLENLLKYYRIHVPNFGTLKSLEVLQDLNA